MNRREFMAAIIAAGALIALPPDPDDDTEVPSVLPPVDDRYLLRPEPSDAGVVRMVEETQAQESRLLVSVAS